jgi:alpha-beta hydrolase superfamily lysophospholipase
VDYIGQLDDDLADLISACRTFYKPHKIIIGGHSSGGGLALRFASGKGARDVDALLLLAPYLKHDAPTTRTDAGWAEANIPRVLAITLLNALGIHFLDHVTTVTFNLPEKYRDGTETLAYSHALISSYTAENYAQDLEKLNKPLLVLVGEKDEVLHASKFSSVIPKRNTTCTEVLAGLTHMGIVVNLDAISAVEGWLQRIAI